MTEKKFRQKVVAEITLAHLTQCAQELGRTLTTEEALDFLNQNGRAYEMWKRSFLDNSFGTGAAIASILMLLFVPFLIYQVRSQRKNNA